MALNITVMNAKYLKQVIDGRAHKFTQILVIDAGSHICGGINDDFGGGGTRRGRARSDHGEGNHYERHSGNKTSHKIRV